MTARTKRQIFTLLLTLLLIFGLAASFAIWYISGALVAPQPLKLQAPDDIPISSLRLVSESGESIAAWHLAAKQSRGVVVLLHGIRSNRQSMLGRARFLYDAGYSSVLIDFQSHGESSGSNITIGYLEQWDVKAAIDFARTMHPEERVAVIGVSMGGAATLLGNPSGLSVVILESVYTDISTAVTNRVRTRLGSLHWLPTQILLWQLKPRLGVSISELSPIKEIRNTKFPVLIISGSEDKHTTLTDTQALFAAAPNVKDLWIVQGAEHEDLYNYTPQEYQSKIINALSRHMKSKGSGAVDTNQ